MDFPHCPLQRAYLYSSQPTFTGQVQAELGASRVSTTVALQGGDTFTGKIGLYRLPAVHYPRTTKRPSRKW